MKKIPLDRPKLHPSFIGNTIVWTKSAPFFRNRRGVLLHRVRSASTSISDPEEPHSCVQYLCGNIGHVFTREDFTDSPAASEVLCIQCEAVAKKRGLPTADELAGYHVHVGRAKAVRACCLNTPVESE